MKTDGFRLFPRFAALLTVLALSAFGFADDDQGAEPARGGGATGAELTSLRTAMELAFLDTGVFHTLENLDDLPAGNGPGNDFDDIDNGGAGTPVLLEATGRFLEMPRDLTFQWGGPYVTYQVGRIEIDPPIEYDEGSPLDFFGQPYRLYSPLGLVDPMTESVVTSDPVGDRFDRWAILTAGPDFEFGTSDDAFREFGGAPSAAVISGVVRVEAPPMPGDDPIFANSDTVGPIPSGSTILVRGYNFGVDQSSSRVLLDGQDLGAAIAWTPTQVVIEIPRILAGEMIQLEIGGTVRDSFAVQIPLSAEDWTLYQ